MSARGSYQTRQQEAVARLFENRPDSCLTAEEAYQELEKELSREGLAIGKTTVYRAITRLCESGELRRYAPQESGESAHYQLNRCRESHLHIRCVRCGAMEHLHCGEIDLFKEHLSHHHGFSLDEGRTLLYGLCAACQNKEETHGFVGLLPFSALLRCFFPFRLSGRNRRRNLPGFGW